MSDADSSVSYREFDRAIEDLRAELLKTEQFFLDNISNARVALGKEIENVEKRTNDRFDLTRAESEKNNAGFAVRFENVNEWRGRFADQQVTFSTKEDNEHLKNEVTLMLQPLKTELDRLSKLSYQQQGGQKQSEASWTKIGIIVLAAGTVASVIISLVALLR